MRVSEQVIDKPNVFGINPHNIPLMDLRFGSNGMLPVFGGVLNGQVFEEWISGTSYVAAPLIPIVLSTPRFFDYMPNPTYLKSCFKALIERKVTKLDGLKRGLEVDKSTRTIGTSGMNVAEPLKVKEKISSLSIEIPEVANRTVARFIEFIIKWGIGHPYTQTPLVSTITDIRKATGGIFTADLYSFSMLCIEPDRFRNYVVDAWLLFNLWFDNSGDDSPNGDIQGTPDLVTHSFSFEPLTIRNDSVTIMAQNVLNGLSIIHEHPEAISIPPFSSISPDLKGEDTNYGYNRFTKLDSAN